MARLYHLVILAAGSPARNLVLGGTTPVRIGSDGACEVCLDDPELAKEHARLEPRDGEWVLVREALPLLVNGLRTKAHLLRPNDLIVLGKNAIAFRSGGAPAEPTMARGFDVATEGALAGKNLPLRFEVEMVRRLHAFARRARSAEEPLAMAEQLVSDVLAITGASRGTLVRFSPDDSPVRMATAAQGEFSVAEVAMSRTILARMRDEQNAMVIENTASNPLSAHAASLVGSPPHSALAVPVAHEGHVIGALYLSGPVGVLGDDEVELVELYASLAVDLVESAREKAALSERLTILGDGDVEDSLLVGRSVPMRELRRTLEKFASSRAPVLLLGETGTGKELVARDLHRKSPRARGPFVAVNCGAISPELLASELFGHMRGAFTQANRDRLGHFRSADGGTLFLDEIGEMPLAQQVALLRVLQEGHVTPVGSDGSVAVDVRLVCATNRPLQADVAAGRFRQDLFFRIGVLTLNIPPLRERRADIIVLANHFLRALAREHHVAALHFSDDALHAMAHAPWTGNVRELEGAVRRAVVLREGLVIRSRELGLDAGLDAASEEVTAVRPLAMARDEFLRDYVRRVVDRFEGNRTAAAEALLVTPRTVFKYLEE